MRDIGALLREDRAVSQVVGVVLVVAITVTLAGLAGTLVLGLGTTGERVPQAQFTVEEVDVDDDGAIEAVNVTHDGGESFPAETLTVAIGGDETSWNPDSEVTVGDEFVVAETGTLPASAVDATVPAVDGETLGLLYRGDDGSVVVLEEPV